jgi:hypothetical protein
MARIRSIHPGIWTDDDFAAVSMAARLLYLGVLGECDDHGVFEWKPIALKMRIFPADKIDVGPLLAELMGVNKVLSVTFEGREYGLVRNFCKFQRPKKPTYRFSLPPDSEDYLGLTASSSPPVPHQFPSGTEKSSLMKEEGGRREENKKEKTADAVPPRYAFENGIIRLSQEHFDKWKRAFSHLDLEAELIGITPWATDQGPQRWFPAVSSLLAKKNREAKLAAEKSQAQPFKWNGIEGVI